MDSYAGDGTAEGFSILRFSYRTKHVLVVDPEKLYPSWVVMTGKQPKDDILVSEWKDTGVSIRYDNDASNVPLQTIKADPNKQVSWELDTTASVPCSRVVIILKGHGTNPVALSGMVGVTPMIDYNVTVTFDLRRGTVTARGTHDGFPAYDFYYDGNQFYKHSALENNQSPFSLFGGGEWSFGPKKLGN
ncbi:MAG: DUF3238 domain-containing protein [Verrucomicrobiales bacterium]